MDVAELKKQFEQDELSSVSVAELTFITIAGKEIQLPPGFKMQAFTTRNKAIHAFEEQERSWLCLKTEGMFCKTFPACATMSGGKACVPVGALVFKTSGKIQGARHHSM